MSDFVYVFLAMLGISWMILARVIYIQWDTVSNLIKTVSALENSNDSLRRTCGGMQRELTEWRNKWKLERMFQTHKNPNAEGAYQEGNQIGQSGTITFEE